MSVTKKTLLVGFILLLVVSAGIIMVPGFINAATTYTVPGQVEAEEYSAMFGIQTEVCSEGTQNVGWIEAGDWLDYSVNVSAAGLYRVDYRVASINTTGRVDLRSGSATLASTTVPNTGGWQSWTTVTANNVNLNAGLQTLRVYAGIGGWNLNWFRFTATATPTPTPISSNLALNRPVTASSTENASYAASAAVDGNTGTRWSSAFSDPQWIYTDLGSVWTVSRVVLNWEAAYARSYQIQVSNDAAGWTTVYSTTTGNGGIDDITFNVTGARYVRMYGTTRATAYGYSLWEFAVYGSGTIATPTPTPDPSTINAFSQIEAENFSSQSGIQTEACSDTGGGEDVGYIQNGDYIAFWNVNFGSGASSFNARVASANSGGNIEIRLDNVSGSLVGTCSVPGTGGWQTWVTQTCSVNGVGGIHNLYLRFTGGAADLMNINWFRFSTSTVTPTPTGGPNPTPDFGPNVHIFDPSMSISSIQSVINNVYNAQQDSQFGSRRDALVFKPGTYNVDIGVGFYTEVLGLGTTPDAVSITGNLHSDSHLPNNNSTCNFWRGATNFSVTPNNGLVKWAVSQAIWFRQMHIRGNMALHQNGGWASGGWMSNTRVDGNVDSGPQQQWISRNTQWGSWTGSNWNMVFVGCVNPPAGNWPNPPYTKVATVPIVREKPFLQIDAAGNYSVRVPSLKTNSSGYDWAGGSVPGTTIPINQFHIAKAGVDTAASINSQLAAGKNLILTPGIYILNDTIRVTRPNTVVLGMGFATLRPNTGLAAMTVADVDGVTISGVLFDAGATNSPVLLEVGASGSTVSHAANPIVLHDVIFRVGGAAVGKATVSFRINANDTIVDHTWVWRADHGSGVGWNSNTAANGLVVNGNNVTIYGLFVEHYQQYQTLWNGNGGRVYFYQSELPYDPPTQTSWKSAADVNGWASYKVSNNVTSHEAWGLGIYAVFTYPNIYLSRAIEVPVNSNVRFHNMITVTITGNGGISNVINNTGGSTLPNVGYTPKVTNFP